MRKERYDDLLIPKVIGIGIMLTALILGCLFISKVVNGSEITDITVDTEVYKNDD